MTPEQGIELLKCADRCNYGEPSVWIKMDSYHALLALLEGLRWKDPHSEPPAMSDEPLLITESKALFHWGQPYILKDGKWINDVIGVMPRDVRYLSLSSILPPAGEPAEPSATPENNHA